MSSNKTIEDNTMTKKNETTKTTKLSKADRALFSEYDAVALATFTSAGLAPKFTKTALVALKDHVAKLPDAKTPATPDDCEKLFTRWTKAYLKKFPELAATRARDAAKKTKQEAEDKRAFDAKRTSPRKTLPASPRGGC